MEPTTEQRRCESFRNYLRPARFPATIDSSKSRSEKETTVYRFLEHTAQLELEIEAGSFEELLAEATRAFAELVAPGSRGVPAHRTVEIARDDEKTIVADWLSELVYLAETDSFVPRRLLACERTPDRISVKLAGFLDAPRPLIKAITYDGLELSESSRGLWQAKVTLDI